MSLTWFNEEESLLDEDARDLLDDVRASSLGRNLHQRPQHQRSCLKGESNEIRLE
jgi:hypothetical protein